MLAADAAVSWHNYKTDNALPMMLTLCQLLTSASAPDPAAAPAEHTSTQHAQSL
jgi:hypothetical protein